MYEQVKVIQIDSPFQNGTFKGFFSRTDESKTGRILRLGIIWGDSFSEPLPDANSKAADVTEFGYADGDNSDADVTSNPPQSHRQT